MTPRQTRKAPLGQLLLQAFRWFDESLRLSLAARGWPPHTHAQSLVFAHIDRQGTRISELARRVGVSRQAMHRTVGELVTLGVMELAPDPTNRSARLVILTEQGKANIEAALKVFADLEAGLATRLGQENIASLRATLEAGWGKPETVQLSARAADTDC